MTEICGRRWIESRYGVLERFGKLNGNYSGTLRQDAAAHFDGELDAPRRHGQIRKPASYEA